MTLAIVLSGTCFSAPFNTTFFRPCLILSNAN